MAKLKAYWDKVRAIQAERNCSSAEARKILREGETTPKSEQFEDVVADIIDTGYKFLKLCGGPKSAIKILNRLGSDT